MILARHNDNHFQAGEPGHMLANDDLLRVDAIGEQELTVSRLIRPGHRAGKPTWSPPFSLAKSYAAAYCDLGYAQTWHTVEGQTVAVGIAVTNDRRTREGLYVGMSRGVQRNEIYAYPSAQEPAGSTIGRPPAAGPEVGRQRRVQAERQSASAAAADEEKDALAIMAPVVRRHEADMSATETRERALLDADHLGALHAHLDRGQHRPAAFTAVRRVAGTRLDH